jgi:hypothetical protein
VRLLEFDDRTKWADVIRQETIKDVGRISLDGKRVSTAQAEKSADVVAKAIVTTRLRSLENTPFIRIQNWRNTDEAISDRLRRILTGSTPIPSTLGSDAFAAHAVAAAVVAALAGEAPIPTVQSRMIDMLNIMHDQNASFGPLFVTHPSDIAAHFDYAERMAELSATLEAAAGR